MSKHENSYQSLKEKLIATTNWPTVYMFKFIIPADNRKLALLERIFDGDNKITKRESKKGNYLSLTIKEVMTSADEVIKKYKKAEKIEGIISL